jgi:hypothetical protein
VQGSGKSYTTNRIIEGCLIESKNPSCCVVCHYDTNQDVICELIGLGIGDASVQQIFILTSPSNYFERKKLYFRMLKGGNVSYDVFPLLITFKSLSTKLLKILMNLKQNDNQLYMQAIINVLRRKAKNEISSRFLSLKEFEDAIKSELKLDSQQQTPLQQRFDLLRSFLRESPENENLLKFSKSNLDELFQPGSLIILDLTDCLIEPNEANNIFRVFLEIFKSANFGIPKLLVLDEAHKYLDLKRDSINSDVSDIIKMQRHYGIRTIISTQNPCILANEIIELANFLIIHRISSPRWFDYLKKLFYIRKYIQVIDYQTHLVSNINVDIYDDLLKLQVGSCYLICPELKINSLVNITKRITIDFGISLLSKYSIIK